MATMVNFTCEAPSNPTTGKVWINPFNGAIWMYFGASWQPIGADEPIQFVYPLTVFIRGVKRTTVESMGVTKTDAITSEIDTLSFNLRDHNASINPVQGEEVIVFKQASAGATPVKWFGGEISSATPMEAYPGQRRFTYYIQCVDYTTKLNAELASESYEDSACGTIIADLVDTYATEFSCNNVAAGPTISQISFNYDRLEKCLKELAERVGYEWYIDYDKDIHFFYKETYAAPYSLTEEDSTTGHYKNLSFMVDKSQLRNVVTVRGGIYISTDQHAQEKVADGVQAGFKLDYKPRSPMNVYVDTGGGYVEKTLGIDNIDGSGYDFVVNVAESLVKNLDHATLSDTNKIKIAYKREIQVITEVRDQESIDALKDIAGGKGIIEHYISDDKLESIDAALEAGRADLYLHADAEVKGMYGTDQGGYRSGQLLTINLPTWQYGSRTYIIQRVTTRLLEDGLTFEYDIEFAGRLKGLADLLIDLLDKTKEKVDRNEETIHDMRSLADENLTLSEDTESTLRDLTTNPYVWGSDADEGRWDNMQWG